MQKYVTSADSTNNLKRLPKKTFLQLYTGIVVENLVEKTVQLKNGLKIMYTENKMIYIESIRKLCNEYNTLNMPVSLTTLFSFKSLYCVMPSEKEKQSCVCINCQNPHPLIQGINRYHTSKNFKSHDLLTTYFQELNSGNKFDELNENISYTYYKYEKAESHRIFRKKKDGATEKYKRLLRIFLTILWKQGTRI